MNDQDQTDEETRDAAPEDERAEALGDGPPTPSPAPPTPAAPPSTPAAPAAPLGVPYTPPAPATPTAPAKTSDVEGSTHTVESTRISPAEQQAHQAYQQSLAAQEGVARQAGDVAVQQAQIRDEQAKKKQALYEQHGAKWQAAVDAGNREVDRAQKIATDAKAAYAAAKPSDFWGDDKDGHRKFLAGIGLFLGGFSASSNGGRNIAYDMIKGAIDRHAQDEAARIGKLRDVAQSAQGDVDIALGRKHEALADLNAWKSNALEQAANELETRLAATGMSAEQVKTNATVAQLRTDAAQNDAQFQSATRQHVTDQVVRKVNSTLGGPNGTGNGAGGVNDRILKTVGNLDSANDSITDLRKAVGQSPVAYLEVQRAIAEQKRQDTLLKSGGVIGRDLTSARIGMGGPTEVGQRLKTPEAKRIWNLMQSAQHSMGTLDEADKGTADQLLDPLGNDPRQFGTNLAQAQKHVQSRRALYDANKPIRDSSAQPAAPRGIRQTRKLRNGQTVTGVLLPNGSFVADGG